jgi:3-hydroxyisobutyrate dehydrogenase-like beta-hydroxyacid dehydrogenase
MSRCLIVGCGCRGQLLAGGLRERGHLVRGSTRSPARGPAIEAAGAQPLIADPDLVATLVPALDHISVVCLLLGSVQASAEQVAALHGSRLETLLFHMIDTTVHGIVYEAAGTVDAATLASGARLLGIKCERSRIPFALVNREPAAGYGEWLADALAAVERVLSAQ